MEKPVPNPEPLRQTAPKIEQELMPPSLKELHALVAKWRQRARSMRRTHDGETGELPRSALMFGYTCVFNCFRELERLLPPAPPPEEPFMTPRLKAYMKAIQDDYPGRRQDLDQYIQIALAAFDAVAELKPSALRDLRR